MSDDRINLRKLPPVDVAPSRPDRLSQTLLAKSDACMRSAYLYLLHGGGAPSHPMDRGTALHIVQERVMLTLIEAGEPTLYAAMAGNAEINVQPEDEVQAKREVASMTAAIVDEVLRDRPELNVPAAQADAIRVMAYHLAVGSDIDPGKVVGVERKFVCEIGGWLVSGKIDVASILEPGFAQVDDYKTSFHVPSQDEYDETFQGRLYSVLLLFGHPVEEIPCEKCRGTGEVPSSDDFTVTVEAAAAYERMYSGAGPRKCSACDGRGFVEELGEPLGLRIQNVRTRELYPRYLREDGLVQRRERTMSRTEVNDFKVDLERAVAKLDQALDTGEWQPVPGSHCGECPAWAECPLPIALRQPALGKDNPKEAGGVTTEEEAIEAAVAWHFLSGMADVERKRVKAWVKANGPVRFGRDLVFEVAVSESTDTDWPALERDAADGKPIDLAAYRKKKPSTRYGKRKLTAEELAAEKAPAPDVRDADERWGAEAPY